MLFLLFVLNHPVGATVQNKGPFLILHFAVQVLGWGVKFLARSKRVLTTDCFCCLGCSDMKLRYLSKWVDLWQTADNKWRFDERLINKLKNGRHSYFSCYIVSCTKLSIVFTRVKNSDKFDFLMITKVSSAYLFHKRGRLPKVSKTRFSTSSMTMFATTDETGELITVPKTDL